MKHYTAYRALGTEAEPKDVPTFHSWWQWGRHVWGQRVTAI